MGFLPSVSYFILSSFYQVAYFETQLSSFWDYEGLGWRLVIATLWTYQCMIEMAQLRNLGLNEHF